jgi:hypothetical protein
MIRKTLFATAIGMTLAGAAFAQTAPQATSQSGPQVTTNGGQNSTVTYPPGQRPAIAGGGQSTAPTVTGSGENMSTERADQTRGNSPTVTGNSTGATGTGTGQAPSSAQVTGSGNNLSTERPSTTRGNSPTGG